MPQILVGTSGYFYEDWKEVFYPKETSKEGYLRYYAGQFRVLELNYSYYRIPEARQTGKMLEDSEEKVEFVVKAYRGITHEISEKSTTEYLPLFIKGIRPFIEKERLGTVLLQFPQGFHYTPNNRLYLKSLIDAFRPLPLSIEFRQKEWLKDSVYETLGELGAGFVCVDEPSLPALIPPMALLTSDPGYIRFHGRNKKAWYGTDSRRRYDYLYSKDELEEWVPRIRDLAAKTDKVFVFFNNHAKAQAVTNAKMLIHLLSTL
jgi:uncharacterized protein YecE (DUF72 family)